MTAAILDFRSAAAPGTPRDAARQMRVSDPLTAHRQPLVCHWRRDADGRLVAIWETDAVPTPARLRRP